MMDSMQKVIANTLIDAQNVIIHILDIHTNTRNAPTAAQRWVSYRKAVIRNDKS